MKEIRSYDAEATEARNAYMRQWRAAHKERCREYARRYWEKKAKKKEAEADDERGQE